MAGSRRPGWDLAAVAALVVVAAAVLLAPAVPRPIQWALAVPFLAFYPGYALVSALFPERPTETRAPPSRGDGTPGWVARLALAIGLSGVAVATVGVLLSWTVGIRLGPAVVAVGAVTLAGLLVAAVRRLSRDPGRRAAPLDGVRSSLRPPAGSRLQTAAFALGVVALLAAVAYAGATPPPGENFTEFYLLSENDAGELVAANYSTTFVAGEGNPVSVAVENHEGRPVSYEVVVVAQSVGPDGSVVGEERVDRFDVEVPAGERAVVERQVAPATPGEGVRLRFLLYEGSAPADPGVESADLSNHLWIDVVEGDA